MLCILGFFGVGAACAAAATWWTKAVSWLLEHQLLVAGAEQPLLTLPGSSGAGLDVPRLALTAAALLLIVAGAVRAVRRSVRKQALP